MPPSILFITNIPSHHQIPFGQAMHHILGDEFRLAFREPLPADRRQLGWRDAGADLPFVIRAWESGAARRAMLDCIRDCDVVVKGDAPTGLVRRRILDGKLTFFAHERIWKRGFWRVLYPVRWCDLWRNVWSVNRANHHLLAASAYAARDFARIGAFRDRAWKWGYFPAMPADPPPPKPPGTPRILWAGRMIAWKQVTHLVQAADLLKRRGLAFHVDLFGVGPDRPNIERSIRRYGLQDAVALHGPIAPDRVGEEMRAAHIYVLPSSFQEGWGVVINEAMAAGCCVVSSHGAGAAPWLIRHGETGFLYPNGDVQRLADLLGELLVAPRRAAAVGQCAWQYIRTVWSPEAAAKGLLDLCRGLLGTAPLPRCADGPGSRAEVQAAAAEGGQRT